MGSEMCIRDRFQSVQRVVHYPSVPLKRVFIDIENFGFRKAMAVLSVDDAQSEHDRNTESGDKTKQRPPKITAFIHLTNTFESTMAQLREASNGPLFVHLTHFKVFWVNFDRKSLCGQHLLTIRAFLL